MSKEMPELAEVETLKRYLEQHIIDYRVDQLICYRKNLRYFLAKDLGTRIKGAKILKILRRAKYLLIYLSNQDVLVVHLGMSGRFTLREANYKSGLHDHVEILISNFSLSKKLIFNDARRFGMIYLSSSAELPQHYIIKNLGPEPLESHFSSEYLQKALKNKKQPIKNSLMDNRIVVGVGNIYASESLFLAGIHPERPSGGLTEKEITSLVDSVKEVLTKAIDAGGTTLRDFVSGDNSPGYFKQELNVYARDGMACKLCGSRVKKSKQAGRATYFCLECQII